MGSVPLSGDNLRIFRGRNGIFEGGEIVCGGTMATSVEIGVSEGMMASAFSW